MKKVLVLVAALSLGLVLALVLVSRLARALESDSLFDWESDLGSDW
jgi:hypothetical protein